LDRQDALFAIFRGNCLETKISGVRLILDEFHRRGGEAIDAIPGFPEFQLALGNSCSQEEFYERISRAGVRLLDAHDDPDLEMYARGAGMVVDLIVAEDAQYTDENADWLCEYFDQIGVDSEKLMQLAKGITTASRWRRQA
jgi:hypothetical protein